ncbi:Dynein light chain [Spironucleus salmonicida]|uniref:Dynein axonemal light chain 4 n=1 Tax=Spironucleus salmonicida TaxID=348837 RepID=V6LQS0_9EUKA|nr:Dynein light chain [Spironucleus salmonicida]|eukprot:EST46051.1 Dynein light chain [Spironucleus salmonicida]
MSDDEDDYLKSMNYPLVIDCDMPEEERVDALEFCVTACEKFPTDPSQCAKVIKDQLDKKFGQSFHVCVGTAYGFAVDNELHHKLHMAYGLLGVLAFKG